MPRCRIDGITWAAKASLISTRSTSPIVIPARARAFRQASTGPSPMISGSSAVTAVDTIRARGVIPSSRARMSLITTIAAAPSFSGQELPAVTDPPYRKTGVSARRASSDVSGRGPSSIETIRPPGRVTGVMSCSKKPPVIAVAALRCDSNANWSCSARETPSIPATFSAVCPIAMYTSGNPSLDVQVSPATAIAVERAAASSKMWLAVSGSVSEFPFTKLLTLSTPAAMNASPSPALMA